MMNNDYCNAKSLNKESAATSAISSSLSLSSPSSSTSSSSNSSLFNTNKNLENYSSLSSSYFQFTTPFKCGHLIPSNLITKLNNSGTGSGGHQMTTMSMIKLNTGFGIKGDEELFKFNEPNQLSEFLKQNQLINNVNKLNNQPQSQQQQQQTQQRPHVVVVDQAPFSVLKSVKSQEQNQKTNNVVVISSHRNHPYNNSIRPNSSTNTFVSTPSLTTSVVVVAAGNGSTAGGGSGSAEMETSLENDENSLTRLKRFESSSSTQPSITTTPSTISTKPISCVAAESTNKQISTGGLNRNSSSNAILAHLQSISPNFKSIFVRPKNCKPIDSSTILSRSSKTNNAKSIQLNQQLERHESSLLPLLYSSAMSSQRTTTRQSNGTMSTITTRTNPSVLINMLPSIEPKELRLNSSVDEILLKFANQNDLISRAIKNATTTTSLSASPQSTSSQSSKSTSPQSNPLLAANEFRLVNRSSNVSPTSLEFRLLNQPTDNKLLQTTPKSSSYSSKTTTTTTSTSAISGIDTPTTKQDNKWTCMICLSKHASKLDVCSICGSSKPNAQMLPPSSSSASLQSQHMSLSNSLLKIKKIQQSSTAGSLHEHLNGTSGSRAGSPSTSPSSKLFASYLINELGLKHKMMTSPTHLLSSGDLSDSSDQQQSTTSTKNSNLNVSIKNPYLKKWTCIHCNYSNDSLKIVCLNCRWIKTSPSSSQSKLDESNRNSNSDSETPTKRNRVNDSEETTSNNKSNDNNNNNILLKSGSFCASCKSPIHGDQSTSDSTTLEQKDKTAETTPKPTDKQQPSLFAALGASQASKWNCDTCLASNPDTSDKCACCMSPKPSSGGGGGAKPLETVKQPSLFTTIGASQSKKWNCDTCLAPNPDTSDKCVCCMSPKPSSGGAKPSEPAKQPSLFNSLSSSQSTKWNCGTCLVSNPDTSDKCVCCMSPKPSGAAKSSTDSSTKPSTPSLFELKKPDSTAKWTCSTCLVQNDADKSQCVCCQTNRPSSLSSSDDKSKQSQIKTSLTTIPTLILPSSNSASSLSTTIKFGSSGSTGPITFGSSSSNIFKDTNNPTQQIKFGAPSSSSSSLFKIPAAPVTPQTLSLSTTTIAKPSESIASSLAPSAPSASSVNPKPVDQIIDSSKISLPFSFKPLVSLDTTNKSNDNATPNSTEPPAAATSLTTTGFKFGNSLANSNSFSFSSNKSSIEKSNEPTQSLFSTSSSNAPTSFFNLSKSTDTSNTTTTSTSMFSSTLATNNNNNISSTTSTTTGTTPQFKFGLSMPSSSSNESSTNNNNSSQISNALSSSTAPSTATATAATASTTSTLNFPSFLNPSSSSQPQPFSLFAATQSKTPFGSGGSTDSVDNSTNKNPNLSTTSTSFGTTGFGTKSSSFFQMSNPSTGTTGSSTTGLLNQQATSTTNQPQNSIFGSSLNSSSTPSNASTSSTESNKSLFGSGTSTTLGSTNLFSLANNQTQTPSQSLFGTTTTTTSTTATTNPTFSLGTQSGSNASGNNIQSIFSTQRPTTPSNQQQSSTPSTFGSMFQNNTSQSVNSMFGNQTTTNPTSTTTPSFSFNTTPNTTQSTSNQPTSSANSIFGSQTLTPNSTQSPPQQQQQQQQHQQSSLISSLGSNNSSFQFTPNSFNSANSTPNSSLSNLNDQPPNKFPNLSFNPSLNPVINFTSNAPPSSSNGIIQFTATSEQNQSADMSQRRVRKAVRKLR